MRPEHLVTPGHKKMLKGKRKKVGGFQKGMGADLKVCNGQS